MKSKLMTKILTVAFLLLTLTCFGQKGQVVDKGKQRLDKVCDTFMKLFTEGKTRDALQLLKQNTVMAPASIDTLQVTIDNQMNNYFPTYGKMLSYEFISERKIKDFIAKRFYILKFDIYYLKFDFTLYKAASGWTVTNFKYDEELSELLY
jgi:predicted Zn-dependent protease